MQKHGDTGDKSAKPSNRAGLQPIGNRGQSGDKPGTKRGHFYMMKLIHSFIYCQFPLASPAPAPLPALLAALARYWNWAREGLLLEPSHRPRSVDNFSALVSLAGAYILSNSGTARNCASTLKNSLKAEFLSTIRMFYDGRYVNKAYKKDKYV